MTAYIEMLDVCYSVANREVIKDLNLSIQKDEFIALVGENGCGKTTLTKLLLGILKTDTGEIKIDDRSVEKYKLHEIGAKIGYVFQNPSYQIFAPTIEEELSFAMKYKGIDENIINERVQETIKHFSLEDARDVTTYNLSQGEKQRLAIGCMMLNEPEFMILDEPTVGLDAERKNKLFEHLSEINKQGIGVMVISHDKEIVEKYAQRIILMKDGKAYECI